MKGETEEIRDERRCEMKGETEEIRDERREREEREM